MAQTYALSGPPAVHTDHGQRTKTEQAAGTLCPALDWPPDPFRPDKRRGTPAPPRILKLGTNSWYVQETELVSFTE
jgi:hypothetical protein